MKYVKGMCVIVSLVAVFVCFGSPAFSSEITPDEVLKLADQEKEAYFGMIAFDYVTKYRSNESSPSPKSFQTLEDAMADSAKNQNKALNLVNPFQVYTINSNDITNYREGEDISGMLIPTKLWLIPLEIHGKAHACMEVGFLNGKWQVVGISMGEFGENIKRIPSEFAPGKSNNKFVRVYPAYTDFVAVESEGETKAMVPSYSEKFSKEISKDSQGLYRSSSIMPELAKKIRDAQDVQY